MKPLCVGILGAARISENAIVAPSRLAGVRLVAVAAREPSRAQEFARAAGVERVLNSYADVVNDPEVEVVYNPLANGLHAPWNLAAIAAGKHVLSEKPFASNAEEAAEVRDAAEEAGVEVVEGLHYLYHPATRRLHELIASGELGRVQRVETMMSIPPPAPEDPRWSLDLAGGALMDLGCYALHAQRVVAPWTGGPPIITSARGRERKGLPGVDEWVEVDLTFPCGATGLARCNMAGNFPEMTYRVIGSLGEATVENFVVPQLDDRLSIKTRDGSRVEHLGTKTSYTYQLEALMALIHQGTRMPTDANDAVATMQLIDEAYRTIGLSPRPRSPRII